MRFVPAAGKLAPWFGHGSNENPWHRLSWKTAVELRQRAQSKPLKHLRRTCSIYVILCIYSYVIYIHSYLYLHVCNIILIKSKWFMLLARHRAVLKFPDANWVLMPLVQVVCEHEGLTWKLIHQKGLLRQDWLSLQGLHSIWVLWCPWHHYNHCIVRCPSSWDYWYLNNVYLYTGCIMTIHDSWMHKYKVLSGSEPIQGFLTFTAAVSIFAPDLARASATWHLSQHGPQ